MAFIVATVTCQPDEPSEDNADTPSATDATTLRDGRIVVVDRGSDELRVFDALGIHLASWGGRGEGPGEFIDL